jgi:SagB-type dehydrogenase family enzyme
LAGRTLDANAVLMARIKRSGSLIFFFRDGELHCRNFLTDREIAAIPKLVEILARLDRWRTPAAASRLFAGYSPGSVWRSIDELTRSTVLTREGSSEARREAALTAWEPWGIEAQTFHFGTKRAHRQEPVADEARYSRKLLRERPEPPQVKRYARARGQSLPAAERQRLATEFPGVLLQRRTHRSFGPGSLSLQDLSLILALTWRITGWRPWPGLRPRPLKTSPSGGARHSLEVYVFCRRVTGVQPGVYHYRPDLHRLEMVREQASGRLWSRFCGHQDWVARASALFVVTSVLPRVMWRYRFARAYRTLLLETGHFGQTFCLVATWLGLAPFTTAALDDEAIEGHLGLDGGTESVVYAMGVGPRAAKLAKRQSSP